MDAVALLGIGVGGVALVAGAPLFGIIVVVLALAFIYVVQHHRTAANAAAVDLPQPHALRAPPIEHQQEDDDPVIDQRIWAVQPSDAKYALQSMRAQERADLDYLHSRLKWIQSFSKTNRGIRDRYAATVVQPERAEDEK